MARKKDKARANKTEKSVSRTAPRNPGVIESGLIKEVLAGLPTGVALSSADGTLLYANRRFADLLGFAPHRQIVGMSLTQVLLPRSWSDLEAALRQAVSGPAQGDLTLDGAGRTRTVRMQFSLIHDQYIRIMASEVTELVETSRALLTSQSSLRSLSARILRVEDEERRRLARDLHDNTGQEIAALSLSLRRAEVLTEDAAPDVRVAISESIGFSSRIETQIRTLSYLLHPPLLDEFGLRAAIGWFVDGFKERSGIDLKLKIPQSLPRFSLQQEIALFRVVQGALTNVLRHSGSSSARIRISLKSDTIQLVVEDDGQGMTENQLQAVRQGLGGGVGIGGMRERLYELGGTLEVNSSATGTQIIATLPVQRMADADKAAETQSQALSPTESFENAEPAICVTESSGPARILIADDHAVAREGIKTLLASDPEMSVIGEAVDGADAIAKTEELHPDLLILDLSMPRLGGLAAAARIRESGHEPKILIFTTHSFPGLAGSVKAAGCQGYVLKEHAGSDLVNGIHEILRGNPFYSSS